MKQTISQIATALVVIAITGYVLLGDKLANYSISVNNADQYDGKTVSITGFKGIKRSITIPSKIRKMPVVTIGDFAFSGVDFVDVDGILLPQDMLGVFGKSHTGPKMLEIDELIYKFSRGKLNSVTMPDGISVIGSHAFYGNKLKKVEFPNTLTLIKEAAFLKNDLDKIVLPAGLSYIDEYAFAGNNISDITIGSGVLLGKESFNNNFPVFYIKNNREAGHYFFVDNTWHFEDTPNL
jgi:hypothetical protein